MKIRRRLQEVNLLARHPVTRSVVSIIVAEGRYSGRLRPAREFPNERLFRKAETVQHHDSADAIARRPIEVATQGDAIAR